MSMSKEVDVGTELETRMVARAGPRPSSCGSRALGGRRRARERGGRSPGADDKLGQRAGLRRGTEKKES